MSIVRIFIVTILISVCSAASWGQSPATECPVVPMGTQATQERFEQLRQLRAATDRARARFQNAQQIAEGTHRRLREADERLTALLAPQRETASRNSQSAARLISRQERALANLQSFGVSDADALIWTIGPEEPELDAIPQSLGENSSAILDAIRQYRTATALLDALNDDGASREEGDGDTNSAEAERARINAHRLHDDAVDEVEEQWLEFSNAMAALRAERIALEVQISSIYPPRITELTVQDDQNDRFSVAWPDTDESIASELAIVDFLRRGLATAIDREGEAIDAHIVNVREAQAHFDQANQALLDTIENTGFLRTITSTTDFAFSTVRDTSAGIPIGASLILSAALRWEDFWITGAGGYGYLTGTAIPVIRRGPDIVSLLGQADTRLAGAPVADEREFLLGVTSSSLTHQLDDIRIWFGEETLQGNRQEVLDRLLSIYAEDSCAAIFAEARRSGFPWMEGENTSAISRLCPVNGAPLPPFNAVPTQNDNASYTPTLSAELFVFYPLYYRTTSRSVAALIRPEIVDSIATQIQRTGNSRLVSQFDSYVRAGGQSSARIGSETALDLRSSANASRAGLLRGLMVGVFQAAAVSAVETGLNYQRLESAAAVVAADMERVNAINHLQFRGHLRRYYRRLDAALAVHAAYLDEQRDVQLMTRDPVHEFDSQIDGLTGDLTVTVTFSEPVTLNCIALGQAVANTSPSGAESDSGEVWEASFTSNDVLGDLESAEVPLYVIAHSGDSERVLDGDPRTVPYLTGSADVMANWEQTAFQTPVPINSFVEDAIGIVFDNSRSMERNERLAPARAAVIALLDEIDQDSSDIVSITHFQGECGTNTIGFTRDSNLIATTVQSISADSSTPLAAAIRAATDELLAVRNAERRILYVLTDGEEQCDGNPAVEMHRARQRLELAQCADAVSCEVGQ